MNWVQFVCLVIAGGFMVWSIVSFVLKLVRKHKADKSASRDSDESGGN